MLFLSQVSERVDDHTKNEIERDNNYDEKEEQVVDQAEEKKRFLKLIQTKFKYFLFPLFF